MYIAAFISKLQHFEILKLSYLDTCKLAIRSILSDQVAYTKFAENHTSSFWDTNE